MPRRNDLESILVIGSGPIVIGQACEFDYSGTQACRVLREEGYRVILANSNPATIMTDPDFADRDLRRAARRPTCSPRSSSGSGPTPCCRPSAARPPSTWPWPCVERGVLERYGVEMIGANAEAIAHRRGPRAVQGGHDRDRPGRARLRVRLHPRRGPRRRASAIGFPVIVRPSLILGGAGTGIAADAERAAPRMAADGPGGQPDRARS